MRSPPAASSVSHSYATGMILHGAGGIGNSFTLNATCAPSTLGELSYMPSSLPLPVLPMPVSVAVCGPGTEQLGSFCRQCDLNTYDFDGLNCLPCPYGELAHLKVCHVPLGHAPPGSLVSEVPLPPSCTA